MDQVKEVGEPLVLNESLTVWCCREAWAIITLLVVLGKKLMHREGK